MRTFVRIVDKIIDLSGLILMWFPWILTVIIVWELILRNGFNHPTAWAHEFSVMFFGVLTITSGAYALKERAHVNMDLFYINLSERGKAIMNIIVFPAFFVFVIIILWLGWEFALRAIKLNERSISMWSPIIWPVKLMLPVGAFLLLIEGIALLFKDILTLTSKERKVS
jgi:TRAP-type mannitol/chloroaromatic compound transport system permease small subunit